MVLIYMQHTRRAGKVLYDDGPLAVDACMQSRQLIRPFLPLLNGFNDPRIQVPLLLCLPRRPMLTRRF